MTITTKTANGKPQAPKAQAMTVAEAEAVVSRLQEQREKLVAERSRVENETSKYAYAAHAHGDMKAVEALDQITSNIARLDARVREVDLAIAEAGERLKQAQTAEATAADRQRAGEMRKLVAEMGQVFPFVRQASRGCGRWAARDRTGFQPTA
jgi:hypothetical protein